MTTPEGVSMALELVNSITYKKEVDYHMRFDGNSNEQHSLILLAKDQNTYDVWSDGINVLLDNNLLDQKSTTKNVSKFQKELEDLMIIELRQSLLNPCDTSHFETIPTAPPPPANYNFVNFRICPETKRIIPNEA